MFSCSTNRRRFASVTAATRRSTRRTCSPASCSACSRAGAGEGRPVDSFMFGDGPTGRFVAWLGWHKVRAVTSLPGGESGIPGNPFYLNLLEPYLGNETYPLLTSPHAISAGAYSSDFYRPWGIARRKNGNDRGSTARWNSRWVRAKFANGVASTAKALKNLIHSRPPPQFPGRAEKAPRQMYTTRQFDRRRRPARSLWRQGALQRTRLDSERRESRQLRARPVVVPHQFDLVAAERRIRQRRQRRGKQVPDDVRHRQ